MNRTTNSKLSHCIIYITILSLLFAFFLIDAKSLDTSYGRPWTTPEKSINGGATYLAEKYISKGQYTLYLQRFNVDPNATYSTYTHLYMTNIQAISSEASKMYTSYKSNGLLSQTIEFVIPVYNNMPDKTTLADGTAIDTSGISSTDSAFETSINDFPSSYKGMLRKLHSEHNNWKFVPLFTGLEWTDAVKGFQKSSAIYYSQPESYRYTPYTLVESNGKWYRASDQTTAFYLDPRNFLTNEGILMFERMNFSSSYTVSSIQTVISNSFMSGSINGKSYAQIFYDAGKNNDINPVHLASRALQEQGTTGATGSKGELVSYNGKYYKGIYNYFNIGANSGAAEGIAWASGGQTYDINDATYSSGDVNKDGKINAKDLLKVEKYIVNSSLNNLSTEEFKLADVNNDGKVNAKDLLKIEKYIVNGTPI